MASRRQPPELSRSAPRLYVVTPPDASGRTVGLAAALAVAEVAAVLVRLPQTDERALVRHVQALAPMVQDRGVAVLLDGHPELAGRTGADGAHLTGIEAFEAACPMLKPARIAGCGGVATRHDAMVAAEAGADYVMFGEPDASGHRPTLEAILERIAWWAELFEVPCVGFAASLEEVAPLAVAGADFVAVGDFIFRDPRGPGPAVADAARRLVPAETTA
ncbi:MAG: thiamine phosphate synthase [Hyphomicrobiales bacterium]|nr:thiamine phosphate synthase [Hyphomicrobiales bacterium]